MPEVSIYDTRFEVCRGELPHMREKESNPHWENFKDAMRFLGSIGFYVGEDKEIKRMYPALNDSRRAGRYAVWQAAPAVGRLSRSDCTADLKFKAEWHQNVFRIHFYQDVQFENPNGGYYDFDKLEKMPYLIRKQYELTERKLTAYFEGKGFRVCPRKKMMRGKAFIVNDYIGSCHHPQKEWFRLEEVDGQTPEHEYNAKDRDGKILHNGETKYFRDWGGYLCRGVVYHNINNMWWVLPSDGDVMNKACFELFDLTDAEPRRRVKEHRPPEEYAERKKWLSLCSTKELENELKRRRRAV